MILKLLLFSDNTWEVCYDTQIEDFITNHKWRTQIPRDVIIFDAPEQREERELETIEEWKERIKPYTTLKHDHSISETILNTMIKSYDKKI